MYQFCLTHGLCDLIPTAFSRIKEVIFICRHFPFPAFDPQYLIQLRLKAFLPVPELLIIRTIFHTDAIHKSHRQTHNKMIADCPKGDRQRVPYPCMQKTVKERKQNRKQDTSQCRAFHFLLHDLNPFCIQLYHQKMIISTFKQRKRP